MTREVMYTIRSASL